MGLGISWSKRGGLRLNASVRAGRVRVGESIPLTKTRGGRKQRTRKWISFRA